ncbi:55.5 kDa and 49.5 kDa sporulation protein [Amycolatopsis sp. M39]|nr:55.5 kDa and 49.5 kDa sporulation protein [Amycolatopsis sp. M39]
MQAPPAHLGDDFWTTDDFKAVFESHHFGKVLKVYRNHPRHLKMFGKALNQGLLGRWLGLTQPQISRLESGPPEQVLSNLVRYAKTLHIPQEFLWFDYPGQTRLSMREDLRTSPLLAPPTEPATSSSELRWPDASEILVDHVFQDVVEPERTRTLAQGIRATTADLMEIDFKRGGGHVRRMLKHYFEEEVAPLLSWQFSDSRLRDEVFGAAAETLQLMGWSAYDAGDHQAANRYFRQALSLAQRSNDAMMAGRILANLSHQANFLGHFKHSLQLARRAQEISRGRATGRVTAMFLAMEARALASLGELKGTTEVLRKAEHVYETRSSENDPEWSGYFTMQEMASEAAHCFRDLGQSDQCREFAELSMDPQHTPPRTLGFMRMVAASGVLAGGDTEQAAALAAEAIELGVSLQSARYVKYVTDFRRSLTEKDSALGGRVSELLRQHYPTLVLPRQ